MHVRNTSPPMMTDIESLEGEFDALRSRLDNDQELVRLARLEKGRFVAEQLERGKEKEVSQERAQQQDSLTGFLRHGPFRERFGFEIERVHQCKELLTVLWFSVRELNAINEAYGFRKGDQVIATIAKTTPTLWMEKLTRRPPVFGRDGGNRFAVLLPGEDEEEGLARAQALSVRVARLPFFAEPVHIDVAVISGGKTLVDAKRWWLLAKQTLCDAAAQRKCLVRRVEES